MKNRKEINWSKNDNWETPKYVLDWIEKEIFEWKKYFDPCPLSEKIWDEYIIEFNWLDIEWEDINFVNPPYNTKWKQDFIKKCYKEYNKWKISVLLIPATTETKFFHEYIAPYAWIYFIKWRVSFKWYNSYWKYVTDRTWQSGSMLCIFNPKWKPYMTTLELNHKNNEK